MTHSYWRCDWTHTHPNEPVVILYEVDGKEYRLTAGDTLHFPSKLPHRARNVGKGPARELWVGTTRIIKED